MILNLQLKLVTAIALFASTALAQSPHPGMGSVPVTGGGVSFRVWAPHATGVQVRGEFNGYGSANPMVLEGSSGLWSTFVPGASIGQQYKYYLTNTAPTIPGTTTVWRRDPHSRVVHTFTPGDANSVIYNPATYNWGSTATYTPPARSQVVIYEMHVGSFNAPSGTPATFDQAILRLDAVVQLGANMVEVMPPTEVPSTNGWGYDPILPYSIDESLGGPDAFKRFVSACHTRGLGVIADVVYNHAGPTQNDLYNFDLWSTGDGGGIYFFNNAADRDSPWGPRFDYSSPQVQSFLMGSVRMYLDEYHVDGFRFDATAFLRYGGNGAVPGAAAFLTSATQTIAAEYPGKLVIAEDLDPDQLASKPVAQGGLGFDAEWDSFSDRAAEFLSVSDQNRNLGSMRAALEKVFHADAFRRVVYVESHDTAAAENVPYRVLPVQGGYLPRRLNQSDPETSLTTRRLSMMGSVLTFTAPGIPMMFMGQELFESGTFEFPNPGAMNWSALETSHGGLLQLHKDLIALRKNVAGNTRGLTGPTIAIIQQNDGGKVLAFLRQDQGGAGDEVVVLANFAQTDYTSGYYIGVPRLGTWKVRFNSDLTSYDPQFSTAPGTMVSVVAENIARDGNNYRINIPRLRPYTALILSQDAPPAAGIEDWRALQ